MSNSNTDSRYKLLHPQPKYYEEIQNLCRRVYPFSKPWSLEQLESHRNYFPDGQLIVIDKKTKKVVGLAFSLIISWDDYSPQDSWGDFTSAGHFRNHNPKKGRTLYGAEVMVDPEYRGQGIGKLLYAGRKEIVEKYDLKRIRAGARLRGYSKFKDKLTPQEYVNQVITKKITDPTLTFQLSQGFVVIGVAKNYLFNDPESLGYAAVIEWLNPKLAKPSELKRQQESVTSFLQGERYVPESLPRELRKMVRKATLTLGNTLKESEGEKFLKRIEYYRENLKKLRVEKDKSRLEHLLKSLRREKKQDRLKIAHAFSLQLELVNACESAYRTWRQLQKPSAHNLKNKVDLSFILTAHPTEARSKNVVELLNRLTQVLIEGINNNFVFSEPELNGILRMLWIHPLSKLQPPKVQDEADYIYSLTLTDEMLDFILKDKPNYELFLITWVGGDKDGHPWVDQKTMIDSLSRSRVYLIKNLKRKLEALIHDLKILEGIGQRKYRAEGLKRLLNDLTTLEILSANDGNRVKKWTLQFKSLLKTAPLIVQKHHETNSILRLMELFPALVLPLELREDANLIKEALSDKSSAIRAMIAEIHKVSGILKITHYIKGLIISNCESVEDLENASKLIYSITRNRHLPVIPLFETKDAILQSKHILKAWLNTGNHLEKVQRYWDNKFEVMLGYSDSAKQTGSLSSRYLIKKAMFEIESTLKNLGVKPLFFHGSGGSVDRGGGSLKEQISWWSFSATQSPRMTIQGEMIQRTFATKEILNSQCSHLSDEALRRKTRRIKSEKSPELERFIEIVEGEYKKLIQDKNRLQTLLQATPYKYLQLLKIGSRPTKRYSTDVSVSSLRAIPWVLCWTQTRVLLPTWWGIGTAWSKMDSSSKVSLKRLFQVDPFFSSFVKIMGFTLSKVELDVWELYFQNEQPLELFKEFRIEYKNASQFVQEISGQKSLLWYRPWLEESIRLRSPHIHLLNLLQILAMQENDEPLLKETLVGIACGMLTTG